MTPRILRRRPAFLVEPACKPNGEHWHRLVDWQATTDVSNPVLGQFSIGHEWIRGTGHPTSPDPARPHAHKWSEAELRRALAPSLAGRELEYAIETMAGLWQTGPSIAERPDGSTWLEDEEAVARTLHPELRPAKFRDLKN